MDPDSTKSVFVRLAPWSLAALIVVGAMVLVGMNRLDGKDLIALVGSAIAVAGVARMMTFPSATTTTKQTDPSGAVTETKTQQPLGMPAPPAPIVTLSPTPSPGGTTL